jgi:hypothetical protein
MQYMLLIHANEAAEQAMSQEKMGQIMAAFGAYTEALKKEGAYLGSNRLQPVAAATTVRVRDGKTTVLNGPYAETREQLGGYYLIDVPDLAIAQDWAARCPSAAFGTIEVRPVWAM